MRSRTTLVLLLVAVPVVSAASTIGYRYVRERWFTSVPRLECPRTLNLGERSRGEVAVGKFRVRNAGTGGLLLKDFQTSCSCAGVEREIEGQLSRVKLVQLAPGDTVDLTVRVGVGVRPGERQEVQVGFTTNDPAHPTWTMLVAVPRVRGGYFPQPAAVVFGALIPGEQSRQVVDLYDNAAPDREAASVTSSHPERFSVHLLPLSEDDRKRTHETAGRLFARVEVVAKTEHPGRLDGEILVELRNEEHRSDPIPVLGEVVGLAECRPAALVLPRRVERQRVNWGEVFIVSRQENPTEVVLEPVPPGLTAEVHPVAGCPHQRLLRLEWHPAANGTRAAGSEVRVRLRVNVGGSETPLEMRVLFAEEEAS